MCLFEFCVLSGRGFCDRLVKRSPTECRVFQHNREASLIRRSRSPRDVDLGGKNIKLKRR